MDVAAAGWLGPAALLSAGAVLRALYRDQHYAARGLQYNVLRGLGSCVHVEDVGELGKLRVALSRMPLSLKVDHSLPNASARDTSTSQIRPTCLMATSRWGSILRTIFIRSSSLSENVIWVGVGGMPF